LDRARRRELIEFTPEYMADIPRGAKEAYLRGDQPKPDVCP
jgi:hypothetical protein